MSDPKQLKIALRSKYADTYKNIPVTAFNIGTSEKGIELTCYVDEDDFAPEQQIEPNTIYIKRTIETRLTVNPFQAKALLALLSKNIKDYEDVFGKLPSPDEIQQRALEKQKQTVRNLPQNTSSTRSSGGIQ
jgi:hypothetical protein